MTDFMDAKDPFALFKIWLDEAWTSEINDANAMALSTVDSGGVPNVRIVLLKEYDLDGFVFYSHFDGTKGTEISANNNVAFVMHWKSLLRQIRVRGATERVSDAQADAYYQSRHRNSQIGAWVSKQSRSLPSREVFDDAFAAKAKEFEGVEPLPRPPLWGGTRIIPSHFEFWQDRPHRLHDRLTFDLSEDGSWSTDRLYP